MNRLALVPVPPAQVGRRLRGMFAALRAPGRDWLELSAGAGRQGDLGAAVARLITPPGAASRAWTALAARETSGFVRELAATAGLAAEVGPAGTVVGGDDAGLAAELVEGAAAGPGGLLLLIHPSESAAGVRQLLRDGTVGAAADLAATAVVVEADPNGALVTGETALLAALAGQATPIQLAIRTRVRRVPAAIVVVSAVAAIAAVARLAGGGSTATAPPSPAPSVPPTSAPPGGPTLAPSSPHPGTAPSARQGPAAAWDTAGRRLVLFGGTGDAAPRLDLADTWTWDGAAWQEETPGTSPPARSAAVMAAAPGGGVLLVGGMHRVGIDFVAQPLQDTWRWDGSTWTSLPSAGGPRPGEHTVALVADPSTSSGAGLLLLTSTQDGVTSAFNWSGSAWVPAGSATQAPRVRLAAADPDHHQVIVVAGDGSPIQVSSTWAWRAGTWTELRPPSGVYVDDTAVLTFDPSSRHDVLVEAHFSGLGGVIPASADRGGTWIWDGATWTQVPGPVPSFVSTFNATSEALAYPGGILTLVGGDRGQGAYRQVARWNAPESRWESA